jgi:membrane protein YdbS with pleckstrin-like domain
MRTDDRCVTSVVADQEEGAMSQFKFNCPHCQQPLEATEDLLGKTVDCPTCKGPIKIPNSSVEAPAPPAPPVPSPPAVPELSARQERQVRDCPFCGEEILATAIKCKHCGEFMDGRGTKPAPASPRKTGLQVENELWKGNPSYLHYFGHFLFGLLLLPLFGVGLILILYAFLDRGTRVFTLTNKRVTSKAGIISRQVHEVGIRDVRNLNVNQGVLERIFGLGTVEIGSAGTAGIEVRFLGIRGPVRVRDLIRRQKDEADSNE